MLAGKAPPSAKFFGDMKNLRGWILQIDNYFTIKRTRNEKQQLPYLGLCIEGKELQLWKAYRHRYITWEERKNAIR